MIGRITPRSLGAPSEEGAARITSLLRCARRSGSLPAMNTQTYSLVLGARETGEFVDMDVEESDAVMRVDDVR